MKNKLIQQSKNSELKLAIASQPDRVQDKNKLWVANPFFKILSESFGRVEMMVTELTDAGLLFSAGDFYVYAGRGGIKVHETPKGVRKQLQKIAEKYNLNIIISDGVLYENDRISVKSDGRIDDIEIIKDQQAMVKGGTIVAPYAVVTVFRNSNEIVAKKIFIIPQPEYQKILQAGSGSNYPTMMAQKSVMKRVANGIYSLLGVAIEKEEHSIDEMEERLSEQEPRTTQKEAIKQKDTFENEAIGTDVVTEIDFDNV